MGVFPSERACWRKVTSKVFESIAAQAERKDVRALRIVSVEYVSEANQRFWGVVVRRDGRGV